MSSHGRTDGRTDGRSDLLEAHHKSSHLESTRMYPPRFLTKIYATTVGAADFSTLLRGKVFSFFLLLFVFPHPFPSAFSTSLFFLSKPSPLSGGFSHRLLNLSRKSGWHCIRPSSQARWQNIMNFELKRHLSTEFTATGRL